MAKRKKSRVYWRQQGGARRAYGDFRDVGGGREALIAPGEQRAATDPVIAERLAADRLSELLGEKRDAVLFGIRRKETLLSFAAYHLVQKAKAGSGTEQHLAAVQQRLDVAAAFFGADRELSSIGVRDVQAFSNDLLERPRRAPERCPACRARRPSLVGRKAACRASGCGHRWQVACMSGANVRHYLNAISNLYRRAQSEGCVPPGFNPVAALMEKPKATRQEAHWLEVHDAALLLEAARTYRPRREEIAMPYAHALIATYLLTGGREKEVLGLEVEDVSFDRGTITFRPNRWRRLKTATSHRSVPLWPQLREILQAYLYGGETPRVSGLLFPSVRSQKDAMITDVRKMLDAVAGRAGWQRGEVRTKAFRHTYCAARLQTLDRGAPVSVYTVGRELGHGGDSLVKRVYGHLGDVRHRVDVVEYRAEQHAERLGDRLRALQASEQQ
ncbi:MAG: site-specific integrase [Gemmatimonadota bacterium]